MEQVIQESLERRIRAAKHLLRTSSLEGLIDLDNLQEEAHTWREFELEEHQILFKLFAFLMGEYSTIELSDVIYTLSTIDRQSALQSLNMAYSVEEVKSNEVI